MSNPHTFPEHTPPQRLTPYRSILSKMFLSFLLSLLLFFSLLGNGGIVVAHALAAPTPPAAAKATNTLNTFLAQKTSSLQPFVFPTQPVSPWAKELQKNTAHVLPSAEPAQMLPLQQVFTPTSLAPSTTSTAPATQMQSSDGRLTVRLPAGAIDASQALTATKVSAASTILQSGLALTVTQATGQNVGTVNSLGFYQFQFRDTQGHALTGIRLRHPITIQYHYSLQTIQGLGLDPGKLLLTWPDQVNQALAAKQATTDLVVPMQNNAATQTLTAQVSLLGTTASLGTGAPANQVPPKPIHGGGAS